MKFIEAKHTFQNESYINLIPISDTHIGDPNFSEKKLKEILEKARQEPSLIILVGDIINNALKSSVSNCYEECIPAGDPQIAKVVEIFKPYSDIIIGGVEGNHERRTRKETNVDLTEKYCLQLGIPYLGVQSLVKIKFGKNAKGDPISYIVLAHHGSGGGRARSGKVEKMIKQEYLVPRSDVYIRSHTHIIDGFPTACFDFDERTLKVFIRHMYHVSSGTYLNVSGYSEEAELPPLPIGSPIIRLNGKVKEIKVTV